MQEHSAPALGAGVRRTLGALALLSLVVGANLLGRDHPGARAEASFPPIGVPRFHVHDPEAAPPSSPARVEAAAPTVGVEDARVAIGRKIFFDRNLSVPTGTSCASCHDPSHGYAGNNGSTLGVARGSRPGHFARRSTPSALYLRFVPRFHLRWDEDADIPEALGGFFWDGRSNSVAKLASQPLLNPNEMANADLRGIKEKLERSAYADELRHEFDHVFESPENAVEALGLCLEAFLTSKEMSPFTSKYDEYLRGHVELTPLERQGLALFDDRSKAACSSCHKFDATSHLPEASMFTDYGYDTVAVPRNRRLPGNTDPRQFDLGVCERRDPKLHTDDEWFCGSFRTPSLRNVAKRPSFMHNGVFTNLRDVVAFYATRGTDPHRWYGATPFDDLPPRYRQYVNVNAAPYNRPEGDAPAFDDHDVDAIVAFLGTLTDEDYPHAP